MSEDMICRMRDRIARTRKVISLAHDPRMIEMLEQNIVEAEADIARLESEQGEPIQLEVNSDPEQRS